MRLSLHCHRHWPEQPQLLADLNKIFSPEQLQQLLDAVTAGGCLLTARFNERELAGALLEWGTTNSLVEGLPDYLTRGQGIPDAVGQDTVAAVRRGCAVLAIQCPSGLLGEYEISQILSLHHGKCFGRSGSYGKPSAPR